MIFNSILLLLLHSFRYCTSDSHHSKVRLDKVQVLTLYKDRYTTGRRSAPVPQLKCIGGSAGCDSVSLDTVQCYNRGSDGVDVQWECKAEMDNAYKFGSVQVTCEGFDYPDDPYVLQGSCGLEYKIERTSQDGSYGSYNYKPLKKSSIISDIIFWIIIGLVLFLLYRIFIAPSSNMGPRTPGDGGSGFYGGGGPGGGGGSPPPGPGFRPDYYPDDSCSGPSTFGAGHSTPRPGSGAGFWTGLGTGGLLGYLLGNRGGNSYYGRQYYDSPGPSHYRSSWTGGSSFGSAGGSRTTSGYGGTRRR